MPAIVLASRSAARIAMLERAGVPVEAVPADLDERAVEAGLGRLSPGEAALALARAKAERVALVRPEAIVVGCDQTLDLDGERFDKPADLAAAGRQLARLRGRTHRLSSAVVCVARGRSIWSHLGEARLVMRDFTDGFLAGYLDAMGARATTTVGGYELEALGAQLFDRVEGDLFTVMGLPLLPLLSFLRETGALPR